MNSIADDFVAELLSHGTSTAKFSWLGTILPDNMNPCGRYWYRSWKEAMSIIRKRNLKAHRGPDYRINAWYCEDCDGWHIGDTHR